MNRREALATMAAASMTPGMLGGRTASASAPTSGNADHSPFRFLMSEDFVQRHNVGWRIEQGSQDAANPLLKPEKPWDSACVMSHGTVMKDPTDGLWKAWYLSIPKGTATASAGRLLTYAESEDGRTWRRPELDLCSYEGRPRTNILLDLASGGPCEYASVLARHPDWPAEKRYEMFIFRRPGFHTSAKSVTGFPPRTGRQLCRYHSPDGKHWLPWHAIDFETSDGLYVYPLESGYVAYHKLNVNCAPGAVVPYEVGVGKCRVICRRTSADGKQWSEREIVLAPDWRDAQDTQFMDLTIFPAKGGYIGMATVYHALDQSIDLQFAASRDGVNWWRPDRRSCLPLLPLGEYGGGMMWPMRRMVLDDGRLYLYYAGCQGLHNDLQSTEPVERMKGAGFPQAVHRYEPARLGNDTYNPIGGLIWFHGALCRASWKAGRLWAAVPLAGGDLPATLTTGDLPAAGSELLVNAVTIDGGLLRAALLVDDNPLPNFGLADCQPFMGDDHAARLRWKGGARSPVDRVQVQFELIRSRLYGFEWVT